MSPPGDGFPFGPGPDEPGPGDPLTSIRRRLFERRMVRLTGRLDDQEANEVGAALMALDAAGDDAVHLQIDSSEGTVGAALTLMDIIELLGVPVQALCIGQAAGPAVGVLAVCHHRQVSPHARLRLYEPPVELAGSARQLEQLAAAHRDQWAGFCSRMAAATGQDLDRLRQDAEDGLFLSAEEAVHYGLADQVAGPDARVYRLPGPPMGFRRR